MMNNRKNSKRKINLSAIVIAFLLSCISVHVIAADEISIGSPEETEAINQVDELVGKKWEKLENWQSNSSWINEQVKLGVVGVIYEKGMIGATVSRNVVPDQMNGWLVVDTITVSAGPLLQLGNLAGNIFLQQAFPYLHVGVATEKSFVNVRKTETYREALLASVFQFKSLPTSLAKLEHLEQGEIVSTTLSGGFYARAGVGVLDLLGVSLNEDISIGPKAKVFAQKSLKLTVSKEDQDTVLILVQKGRKVGGGVGFSLGVSFDDVIDAPVAVGINTNNGYVPLQFNLKTENEKIKSLVYKIDLSTDEGRAAYESFLQKDFSTLDEMADQGHESVVREFQKEGHVNTSEFNAGLDLLFFRTGFRNIYVDAQFNSQMQNGELFEYREVSAKSIFETSSFSGGESHVENYSVLIPTKKGDEEFDSFILDSQTQIADEKTSGKEFAKIIDKIKRNMNQMQLRYQVNKSRDYGDIRVGFRMRFTATAVDRILKATDEEVWMAIAASKGFPDNRIWLNKEKRSIYTSAAADEQEREERREEISQGAKVVYWLNRVKKEDELADQAKRLLKYLRRNRRKKLLHRSMVELAGRDQVLTKGYIRGKAL